MKTLEGKIISRKDEITVDFLSLADSYIHELINGNLQHRWHTKDFADKLFVHPRHLTNTIKTTTGKSPCEHLEDRLLDEIKKMLVESDLPVAEIGYTLLFDDPTNFIKFFKGLAGITPLQYRKKVRAEN
jgi:AraC family transcriptional regulator of adaptative response / methylphosphotriester-DNA alkyltransferase methyltransferase